MREVQWRAILVGTIDVPDNSTDEDIGEELEELLRGHGVYEYFDESEWYEF